ncbi:MAG: tripartite tricarboxylate transporter permease [Sphaerochaeta sp.]|nr:tripartite tricarboxylate transporter permease [Sphaerochaeta sp.]
MAELFLTGFLSIFTIKIIFLITIGVAIGIIFGAIPGLTATMAVALCLPMTFGMEPIAGFSLLIGLYIGGISGGLISAILLNIPGTPASIATAFDGYPMAMRGEAGKALGVGIVFSFIGGFIGILFLILLSPPIASFALRFGTFEYFAVSIFSLTMIISLSGKSIVKGLISGLLGISFAMIGSAPIDSAKRFTFGNYDFDAGLSLLPVLIGLFAISEILRTAEADKDAEEASLASFHIKGFGFSMKEFLSQKWNALRSTMIGLGIGILPGIGGGTANIIAYVAAKNQSKYPEKFGTGVIDGIVASESANNASIAGAMIPLMTLGIPGDTITAMLLGGMMIHGLHPGPLLFVNQPKIVYGIFAALLVANLMMLVLEFLGMRVFVKLLSIPKHILLPIILVLCLVGSYGLNNRMFDVWTMLAFGLIGYTLDKLKFPLPPVILGFILGPIIEINLRRGIMISKGSFVPFFTRPISVVFLLIALFSLIFSIVKSKKSS